MAYTRVNWEDYPSTNTPVSAAKLNIMDAGVADVDSRIGDIAISSIGNSVTDAIDNINTDLSEAKSDISDLEDDFASVKIRYNSTSGKVEYNDNGTWKELKMGGLPALKYSTPLFTFGASNLTYTATKDSYLAGNFGNRNSTAVTLSINNKVINSIKGTATSSTYSAAAVSIMYKLKSGDKVTLSAFNDCTNLNVFEEA